MPRPRDAPRLPVARVTLGRALHEDQENDQALLELTQVLNAAPENLAALRSIAEIHHRGATCRRRSTISLRARVRPQQCRPRAGCRGDLRAIDPARNQPAVADGLSFDEAQREFLASTGVFELPVLPPPAVPGTGSAPECAHDGQTAIRKPRPGARLRLRAPSRRCRPHRSAMHYPCCLPLACAPRAVPRRVRALARRVGGASRIRRHRGVTGPGLPSRPVFLPDFRGDEVKMAPVSDNKSLLQAFTERRGRLMRRLASLGLDALVGRCPPPTSGCISPEVHRQRRAPGGRPRLLPVHHRFALPQVQAGALLASESGGQRPESSMRSTRRWPRQCPRASGASGSRPTACRSTRPCVGRRFSGPR